jgi:hypothetical protein
MSFFHVMELKNIGVFAKANFVCGVVNFVKLN